MSYTLLGRLESRLLAALGPLLAAAGLAVALDARWPLLLVALMLAVGVLLDVAAYHRLIDYQPGWLAVPLGLLELGVVMALVLGLGVDAPVRAALEFYAGAWLLAQLLAHAVFPWLRLTYGEDGGELGPAGIVAVVAPALVLAGFGLSAYATRPPTVRLAAGVHQGPIVVDRTERLIGEPGAVVRGGIVVHADDVEIRDVSVVGGQYGIDVDGATGVRLANVSVTGAELDGIHVRRAQVDISDCFVDSLGNAYGQGIDISFSIDLPPSTVSKCTVFGGREGIVTHSAMAMISGNRVSRTTLRAITMTEMSMGHVADNDVSGALGVGILCGDHSECEISRNAVFDTAPDERSGDLTRMGYGILAQLGAQAHLEDNSVVRSPGGVGSFLNATITRR